MSPAGDSTAAMDPPPEGATPPPDIGWGRAIASGLAILGIGFVAGVYGTNWVLTKLSSVGRSTRQYLASTLFLIIVIAMMWVLRRLQARRLI